MMEIERDLLLQEIEAELNLLHADLTAAARRWQLAGQDPHDDYLGLYISDAKAEALLSRPLGFGWGHLVDLPESEREAQRVWKDRARADLDKLREEMRDAGIRSRIQHLYHHFSLSEFEKQVFWICLAPNIDSRYENLYAYLQDNITKKRPSVNLCLEVLCPPGVGRLAYLSDFSDQATLLRSGLLRWSGIEMDDTPPLIQKQLEVPQTVMRWLLGEYAPEPSYSSAVSLIETCDFSPHPYESRIPESFRGKNLGGELPVIILTGPDQAPKDAAVAYLGMRLGKPVLKVSLNASTSIELATLFRLVSRDARLSDAVLYIHQSGDGAPVLDEIDGDLLVSHSGPVIVSRNRQQNPLSVEGRRVVIHDFQRPSFDQRTTIWKYYLGKYNQGDLPDYNPVSAQFQLTSDQIRTAAMMAGDISAQRGAALTEKDLFAAARSYSNPGLEALARKIHPRYEWRDIVLPADQVEILTELVSTVRLRPIVLDGWGLGKKLVSGTGVTALFSGPPGTGKTMAAEIIAGELYLDLYKIDLSTVVSKYIGETEKNLEKIFSEAEFSNAILFFDEADALFGKRSEVRDSHDRYANIEISYLLQRMEAYDGVTILATNLRSNLDEAFTRRLQFVIDFPFPEVADRLRIWRALFSEEFPQAENLDFDLLAKRFRLAGGNIRNVIVSAAYLAAEDGGKIKMHHLLHGTRRELQKMGRLINQTELELPGLEN